MAQGHNNECVGAGQSGRVYHLTPSIVLKHSWVGNEKDTECERKVYERLGPHPRILKYLGPGPMPIEPERLPPRDIGIRLEYHPKGSLREYIPSDAEIFPLKWAEQIAEGLEYLHRNRIVHCDTSSSNILVTDNLDVVLCDFAGSIIDGVKVNGVSYEQRCSRRYEYTDDFDHIDDLFGFGTVIYELSTRMRPYADKTDQEVRQLYKKGEFPDVSSLEMGSIINKCWHGGYESASAVLVDIRRLASANDETWSFSQYLYSIYALLPSTLKQLFI
ncbi:MAG: hypothetical protein M1834_005437 [Cirrosporium novae-zelandiae]|nr:MAG: hypothetical protein M1834_005437 [Cirrosporium novae-zelandiae]